MKRQRPQSLWKVIPCIAPNRSAVPPSGEGLLYGEVQEELAKAHDRGSESARGTRRTVERLLASRTPVRRKAQVPSKRKRRLAQTEAERTEAQFLQRRLDLDDPEVFASAR